MFKKALIILILSIIVLYSCSTTKDIPENKYLLSSIKVEHATKHATSDLETFSRQQPNNTLRLMLYNAAGTDSTKWTTRMIRKLGEPPVIYNPKEIYKSAGEIQKELVNEGYLRAKVDTILKPEGRKMNVIYDVKAGDPYLVRNYEYSIQDTTMARIMRIINERLFVDANIKKGDFFDMTLLEAEKERVSSVMKNVGYADFSKEYVYFRADTTLNSHQVDLFLDIYPPNDSSLLKRYKMKNITVVSGYNASEIPDARAKIQNSYFRRPDTTYYKGITIIRGKDNFLRNSSIYRNIYLKEGGYYSELNLSKTYESFSKMGAIKQVNISTFPSKEDSLHLMDELIILNPANAHWFRGSLDGTNSAGDIGVAPSVSYQHQNLFNGSEKLAIRLKGAYEFIPNSEKETDAFGQNFYEYGGDVSLTFPMFVFPWLKKSWRESPSATTEFAVGLTNQHRPEYTRQFFNFTTRYRWTTKRTQFIHTLEPMDVNYVRMPWYSKTFEDEYLNDASNPLIKESYKDQLISRTGYTGSVSFSRPYVTLSPVSTLRFGAEVSGLLPRLATLGEGTDVSGTKKILGVSYAEYVKGSADWAQTFFYSKKHSIAYHVGVGIAQPYGNSVILPFERRFFAGGANSIRGWSTRNLGPGSFKPIAGQKNFVNQAGDLLLIFSLEDRHKVAKYLELAAFVDAGNIWTIKDYAGQEGGRFEFDKFYKEIAVAYGGGFRFDLEFLLLRLDIGVRLYDPGRDEGHRFVAPAFSRMAWHFGIGYPF